MLGCWTRPSRHATARTARLQGPLSAMYGYKHRIEDMIRKVAEVCCWPYRTIIIMSLAVMECLSCDDEKNLIIILSACVSTTIQFGRPPTAAVLGSSMPSCVKVLAQTEEHATELTDSNFRKQSADAQLKALR